jgi:ribose-phosphate pyrophosphokinase
MKPTLYALPGAQSFAKPLANRLEASLGELTVRRFPDGESWVRVLGDGAEGDAIVVSSLDRPDQKLCQLLFVAETLRDMGTRRVGLVAPYLPYMRQDERFQAGEGVTSRYFARILSSYFDWLVTVDPHLHRHDSLTELYAIPAYAASSAAALAQCVDAFDDDTVLIGPDAESEQWVVEVARRTGSPQVIFEKTRHGDRHVELGQADLARFRDHQPIIIDDIISTGATMAEAIASVRAAELPAPICVGIHGVFADQAHQHLLDAGARQVLTSNTISHPTNAIDVTEALGEQVAAALRQTAVDAAE